MVDATSHQLQGFYMPTGEPVRFCVHAALGGIYALATAKQNVASAGPTTGVPPPESIRHGMASTTPATPKENRFTVFDTSTNTNYPYTIDRAGGGSVMLHLTDMPWTESVVTDKPSLFRLLRTTHAVFAKSLFKDDRKNLFPTFCHVTLWERPKTLVCMKDIDELQKAIPPSTQDADDYRLACDALDETTGLYLYAARDNEPEDQDPDDYALDTDPAVILAKQKRKAESSIPAGRSSSSSSSPDLANQPIVVSWECRQFPRFSGYPEDPATGVAAGALAVSLEHRYMEAVVKPRRNYFQKQRELLERYKAAGEIPIETTTGSAESRRWKKSERMVEFTEEMYEESRKFLEDGIRDVERPRCYKMYQGTAMGKSSVIVLDQIVWNQTQTQPQTHDKPSSTVDEVKNALDESKRQQSNHGGGDDDDEDVSEFVGKLSQEAQQKKEKKKEKTKKKTTTTTTTNHRLPYYIVPRLFPFDYPAVLPLITVK